MKLLTKINKGLLLFVILLIVLAFYLIDLQITRNKDKPEIKEISKEYIEIFDQYSMLDQNNRKLERTISDSTYSKYLDEAKTKISRLLVDDQKVADSQMQNIKQNLDLQLKGDFVITSIDRTINSYDNFVFDANTVTVSIKSNVRVKYLQKNESVEKEISKQATDSISLIKKDGKWKISYANIAIPLGNLNVTNTNDSYMYTDPFAIDIY